MSRLSVLLIFMVFTFMGTECLSQCIPPHRFETQEALNQFFEENETCDTIFGNLRLEVFSSIPDSLAINDLSPLKNIKAITGGFFIRNLQEISSLDDLESLEYCTALIISDCSKFSSVEKITQLEIENSLQLEALPNLELIDSIPFDSINSINLRRLPIDDLAFLSNFEYIGNFRLDDCDNLTSLTEMAPISMVSAQIINCNNLSECAVESICTIAGQNAHNLTFHDNLGDCNTIEQVAMTCFPDSTFCLRSSFYIRSQTDLDFLTTYPSSCLDSIRSITINEQDHLDPITDLTPLSRFVTLDVLTIQQTTLIENLEGLENLISIDRLTFENNHQLRSTVGLNPSLAVEVLRLASNPLLEDLPLFIESGTLEKIELFNLDAIPSSEYQKLSSIPSIDIFGSPVNEKSFIENNENLTHLKLNAVGGISSLDFSEVTQGLRSLDVFNCTDLQSISHIRFQDTVDDFSIRLNRLTELSIDVAADHFNTISISEPLLEEIDFLDKPTSIQNLGLSENNALKEVNFLDELIYLKSFNAERNDSLKTIHKTSNLTSDLWTIYIEENSSLEKLEAFDNDIISNTIYIQNNPKLEECNIEVICNKYKDQSYSFFVSDNGSGCSIDNIGNICPSIKNPYHNIEINYPEDVVNLQNGFPEMDSIFGSWTIERLYNENNDTIDLSFFRQVKYIKCTLGIEEL